MKPISSIPSGPAGGLADREPERDPLGLYASAIDTSDYVAHVAPLIAQVG